jgi:hypothetical protein
MRDAARGRAGIMPDSFLIGQHMLRMMNAPSDARAHHQAA